MTLVYADMDRVVARLRARLADSAATHGGSPFASSDAGHVVEVWPGLEDVVGRALRSIHHERLRGRAGQVEQGGGNDG